MARRIEVRPRRSLGLVSAIANAREEQDAGAAARYADRLPGPGAVWLEADDVLHEAVLDEVVAVTVAEAMRTPAKHRRRFERETSDVSPFLSRRPRGGGGPRSSLPLVSIRAVEG